MATKYHEIIVRGNDKLLKGFVRGFQIGRSIKGGLWYCGDHPIATAHLKEILTLRGDHIHLVCTGSVRHRFIAAVNQAADLGFETLSDRRIARTHFEFGFETFSRETASAIKKLLDELPPGLALRDYEPQETFDATARGVELYSPVHEYEFRGKGRITGDFESLLSFQKTLSANEFFETADIVIEH
jgi:hypothetical protein